MRRNDGERLDVLESWRVQVLQQVSQRVQVIGNLRQVRFLDVEAYGTAQALDVICR
jgi:hypothetical protein